MREDGIDTEYIRQRVHQYSDEHQVQEKLIGFSIISAIYSLTEIFEFAMRLSRQNALPGGIRIQVELYGLKNRILYFDDFGRLLSGAFICKEGYFKKEGVFQSAESLITEGHSVAIDWFTEIAHLFQWDSAPKALFKEEQRKFLERRR